MYYTRNNKESEIYATELWRVPSVATASMQGGKSRLPVDVRITRSTFVVTIPGPISKRTGLDNNIDDYAIFYLLNMHVSQYLRWLHASICSRHASKMNQDPALKTAYQLVCYLERELDTK